MSSVPNLEFERKKAKAFLKQAHASDPEALRRVQAAHPVSLRDRQPHQLQLADAQHVIARESGFASWPRLVEYFEEMERHRSAPRYNSSDGDVEHFEAQARYVIRRHQRGDPIVVRELAHYVPRFYGRPASEIQATPITEDEARLVIARENRRVSWDELVERASASRAQRDRQTWVNDGTPMARARPAILAHDVGALAAVLDNHPELLAPSVIDREWRSTLASLAISAECDARTPDARRVTDFLASRGVDIQRELDERLLGLPHDRERRPERVRWYLDRGANPRWMPPNGITVLEHALVRYQDAESVDLIAERVTPRRALWIAAGLGDVAGVRSFIAGKGRLTPEGRRNRPDLMAMGSFPPWPPPNQEADDLEIMWEAFRIAGWNGRWAAMDALLDAGLPVDHAPIVWPLILEAVGNMHVALAEYLVSRGADLDREWPEYGSIRSMVRSLVENFHDPQDEKVRQLLAICNAGTVDEILAKVDTKRPSPPPPEERTLRAMQLAADDAARQGQSSVTTENVLVGLLRVGSGVFAQFLVGTGTDMAKLRSILEARLLPDTDPLLGQELPADADAAAVLRVASEEADARRRWQVSPLHLLWGIFSQPNERVSKLLAEVGTDEPKLRDYLRRTL
ncbi:MAG TPA: Clp protease N-terminal domain-containing protein [Gemmatimonadaceae bacterium]|jgi:hypothetical protein|nr:Clp protease N-terminal domain-containing protein [Gemmatimonadaceae bacterium]